MIMSYLNNYANDNIIPCFKGLNNILSESINKQVELMDNNYNNSLNFDIFSNTYFSIKEKYFENIKKSINSYGTSDYEQNLDKKMDSLRTLSENDNQKRNGVITDKIFNELFDKLEQTELFIRTFQNSNEFENLLSNNINKLNLSYKKMKYNINNNNYLDYLVSILDNKMLTIKNMTLYYYNSINITYYKIKNYLNQTIDEIENLLTICNNITYTVIMDKYSLISKEISESNKDYNFENEHNEIDNDKKLIEHSLITQNSDILTKISIVNNHRKAKFFLSIKNETNKNDFKIDFGIINQNSPDEMKIEISTPFGECGKYIDEYIINFNDVNFTTIWNSLSIYLNSFVNFESYKMEYSKYIFENDSEISCVVINGIEFCVTSKCKDIRIIESLSKFIMIGKNYTDTLTLDFFLK